MTTRPAATRIVGRAEPRRRLEELVLASTRGWRSAVLVSGTAGMGKTSLVRDTVESLPASTAVGWGTCWQAEGAPGFWPWMQALDGLTRAVGRDAATTSAGHDRDRLASLVRELGPAPHTAADPDRQRFLLLDAAVRWLGNLTLQQRVVLVLDDLQWADPSTLDLLDHLVAAPLGARLLVIGAYRHDELDRERRARLATLGSRTDNIRLGGLAPEEVEELVGTIRGPAFAREFADELHRRTGGHPLFVRELASLSETGTTEVLPEAVTGVVTRRLGTFPADLGSLLDAASVLGNRLLPDVLAVAVDQPVTAVLERLEPAIAGGVVHTGPGNDLWFAHDLFREVLYRRLGLAERARLHGRIASALEGRGRRGAPVSPGDLARHHAHAVSATNSEKAIHWAREAARDDRRRAAFREAAAHLRRVRQAVADVGGTIEPDVLVQVLLDEADALARSGDPDTARRLLADAASAVPGPERAVDVALAVQRLGAKFSTPRGEIIAQLEAALVSVKGHDVARQARVTAALARELQHSVAEDRRRAEPLSSAALALARDADDDETLASCLLARHDALWRPGTGADRSVLGREIAAVGERLCDTDRLAEGLLLEANGLLESGSPGFRPVLDRWFGLLETRNEPRDRYLVMTRRAALALLEGQADAAESLMHDAADLGERIHEPDAGNVLMSQRVALARARNDPAELTALATDAVRWWTGAPVLAHAVAAGALASAGDVAGAEREVAMLSASGGWRSEGSYLRSVLVADLARAATDLHDTDLCGLLLDDITQLTDSCGVNGAVVAFAGPFAHAAGILTAELGDLPRATRLLEESVDTARRLGATVWVDQAESALRALPAPTKDTAPGTLIASLVRNGTIWTLAFDHERGNVPHVKGMADLATLVGNPGQPVSALQLVGGPASAPGSADPLIDLTALRAYRTRLADLDDEIDQAGRESDLASLSRLDQERDQLLAELRRTTGLGGSIRTAANDPAERARKAVTARIRDAIRRLDAVAPRLAAHLDRSVRTGLRCSYDPPEGEAHLEWRVDA